MFCTFDLACAYGTYGFYSDKTRPAWRKNLSGLKGLVAQEYNTTILVNFQKWFADIRSGLIKVSRVLICLR